MDDSVVLINRYTKVEKFCNVVLRRPLVYWEDRYSTIAPSNTEYSGIVEQSVAETIRTGTNRPDVEVSTRPDCSLVVS